MPHWGTCSGDRVGLTPGPHTRQDKVPTPKISLARGCLGLIERVRLLWHFRNGGLCESSPRTAHEPPLRRLRTGSAEEVRPGRAALRGRLFRKTCPYLGSTSPEVPPRKNRSKLGGHFQPIIPEQTMRPNKAPGFSSFQPLILDDEALTWRVCGRAPCRPLTTPASPGPSVPYCTSGV